MVTTFLQRPNTTVLALVRDLSHETSQSLSTLAKGEGSNVLTVQYDASDPTSAASAIGEIKSKHSITSIDVAVANAGAGFYWGPGVEAPPDELTKHLNVNTVSQIMLFQAALPLLRAAKSPPKFISISSQAGSISSMQAMKRPVQALPYGMSKAALNLAMVVLSNECPDVIVQILTPGRLETGFGGPVVQDFIKKNMGFPATVAESVAGLVKLIDEASTETSSTFKLWNGDVIPW